MMRYPPIHDLFNKDSYQVFLMQCPAPLPFSFAAHTYLVVNREGVLSRYGVSQHKAPIPSWFAFHVCGTECHDYLHKDAKPPTEGVEIFPFLKWFTWQSKVAGYVGGPLAERMADFITKSFISYPYATRYSLPGPNSNTFPAWVLSHFPESGMRQPWNAVGKSWRP